PPPPPPAAPPPPPAGGPHFLGWARARLAAGLAAALAMLRHRAAQQDPAQGEGTAVHAAGISRAHWLADGLLRLAGRDALARSAGGELAWEDLGSVAVRSQWGLLRDFFDVPAALHLRTVPGLDWQLAVARDEVTGETLATQWGPTPASAAYAALLSATARAQFRAAEKGAPQARVLPPDPVGTWSLEIAADRQVHDCLRQLVSRAAALGLCPRAGRLVHDEAVGELPLACGWVALG
ncbi:hypothetical protein, partial [Kitasatospora nipponensis]|uniref:hypothetical protein n=1 Tax=Kitasatospora nipponensis TaxID=258049 RepID=UPI0031D6CC04